MEKRDAMLFQAGADGTPSPFDHNWNIVDLESRRYLRQKVQEIIHLACGSSMTTSEIRQQLLLGVATFGKAFATHLVRSLQCDDAQARQAIVWLLTVLNDTEMIVSLRRMARHEALPRAIRLSAALALAGMGVPCEEAEASLEEYRRVRPYAIS
jgi:hypothetical protein